MLKILRRLITGDYGDLDAIHGEVVFLYREFQVLLEELTGLLQDDPTIDQQDTTDTYLAFTGTYKRLRDRIDRYLGGFYSLSMVERYLYPRLGQHAHYVTMVRVRIAAPYSALHIRSR